MSKSEYDVPKVSLYAAGIAFTLSIGFSFFVASFAFYGYKNTHPFSQSVKSYFVSLHCDHQILINIVKPKDKILASTRFIFNRKKQRIKILI